MPHAAPRPTDRIAELLSLTDPDSHIRDLTAADDAFCRALFHEHRAVQFAPLGLGDEMLRTMLDQQYRAQAMAYAQHFPDAEAFIIEHSGADVGRLIVTLQQEVSKPAISGTQEPPGRITLHLVDISIAAAARNRGIGSDVIGSLARAAHVAGATRFTLLVLHTNQAAWKLYERLGFVAVAEDIHVQMEKPLP